MPRSPTKVTRSQPKRSLALLTCAAKVWVSWVLPRKTSTETGSPPGSHNKPMTICFLCDPGGGPVSVEVFRGNTQDTQTFAAQVNKASERFGCERVTFVGDRGMIKSGQIADLVKVGFHYITAITKPQIETLLKAGLLQMELFDSAV